MQTLQCSAKAMAKSAWSYTEEYRKARNFRGIQNFVDFAGALSMNINFFFTFYKQIVWELMYKTRIFVLQKLLILLFFANPRKFLALWYGLFLALTKSTINNFHFNSSNARFFFPCLKVPHAGVRNMRLWQVLYTEHYKVKALLFIFAHH